MSAILSYVREFGERTVVDIIQFFARSYRSEGQGERGVRIDALLFSAALLMAIGILIQDIILQAKPFGDILWVERALRQAMFWLSVGLVTSLVIRPLAKKHSSWFGMFVALETMPFAYVTGSFAGALMSAALAALPILRIDMFDYQYMPALVNIFVQLTVVAIYLPIGLFQIVGVKRTRTATIPVLLYVLLVDILVVYSPVLQRVVFEGGGE